MVTEVGAAMEPLEGVGMALLEEARGEVRGVVRGVVRWVVMEEVTLGLVAVVKEGGLMARGVEEMGTLEEGVTQGVVMGVELVGMGVEGRVILVGVGMGMEVVAIGGLEVVVKVGAVKGLEAGGWGVGGLVGAVMGVGVVGDTACRSSGSLPCIQLCLALPQAVLHVMQADFVRCHKS